MLVGIEVRSILPSRVGVESNLRTVAGLGTVTGETQVGAYEMSHVWGRGPES